ncbi:MAG: tryptophan synthase subunit alpha [Alphaproteobacteria bacterium]
MSARIRKTFARLKKEDRAAFIPFLMAGDPTLKKSAALMNALAESGADIIELGMPFSDPMADGPVIQEAGLRALKHGAGVRATLTLAAGFRELHPAVPLVLMGYLNPVERYGYEKFARDAGRAGVDGVILVDLPPEESAGVDALLKAQDIALIRLIAPTSIPSRLKLLAKGARGYLYYVSIAGITGAAGASTQSIASALTAIRKETHLPVAVGFGVKTPQDVQALARIADGVIVGSALVKKIAATNGDAKKVAAFARALAKATSR